MGSSTCPPSTVSPSTSSVSIIIINISITFNNVMPGNAGMDKILEMNWFSFILMWAAVFIIDSILAGLIFDQLQKYHKEELTGGCLIFIFVTTMLATLVGGSFLAKFANSSPETSIMFSRKALISR